MRITITQFEGTPEEYARAQPLLNRAGASSEAIEVAPASLKGIEAAPVSVKGGVEDGKEELSAAVIEKALTRRPPSRNQRKVLDAILKAGDGGIYSSALAEKSGISRPELSGVLGATGRRLANTPGWPKNFGIANKEWDVHKRQYRYWLHPVVREVLESGRVKL